MNHHIWWYLETFSLHVKKVWHTKSAIPIQKNRFENDRLTWMLVLVISLFVVVVVVHGEKSIYFNPRLHGY